MSHFEQDSTAKQRRLRPSRARAYFSPQRNLRLPVKTMFRANPNIQIASMMKQFQCDLPRMTCKTNYNHKTLLETKYLSRHVGAAIIPLRSADTDYCKTHRCDAPVPMHKVPQPMQTTIALQHTTVQHIALMHQFQCTKCVNTCKTQKHSIHKQEKK